MSGKAYKLFFQFFEMFPSTLNSEKDRPWESHDYVKQNEENQNEE
jgi:hypothetical protein